MPQRFPAPARMHKLAGALTLTVLLLNTQKAPGQQVETVAIRATVEKSLAADPNYRPGDLISQRHVAAVLSELKAAGWAPVQSKELLQRALADNEYLVRALRTPKGTAFMRRVATMPEGYDRLDRLCRLSGGEQIVERLINGPDGYKLVAYLAESRGGQQLGGMLGRAAQDESFNRPTGRIYTAKQLSAALDKAAAGSK